jgi:hypothetical protein
MRDWCDMIASTFRSVEALRIAVSVAPCTQSAALTLLAESQARQSYVC